MSMLETRHVDVIDSCERESYKILFSLCLSPLSHSNKKAVDPTRRRTHAVVRSIAMNAVSD